MSEPIIQIHVILRDAYLAATAGRPESACPYPIGTGAAHRWISQYRDHARPQEKTAA
jgi:hypothetical protein